MYQVYVVLGSVVARWNEGRGIGGWNEGRGKWWAMYFGRTPTFQWRMAVAMGGGARGGEFGEGDSPGEPIHGLDSTAVFVRAHL